MSAWPTRCADVTWDFCVPADKRHRDWQDGDLVWNPKMGEGHVIAGTRILRRGLVLRLLRNDV